MKKHILIISILLFNYIFSFAQQFTVKGTVYDNTKQKLEYFNASLYSASDTTLIISGAFMQGEFELSAKSKIKCILKITNFNQEEYSQIIDFTKNDTYKLDSIILKTINLSEVVVQAKRPQYSYNNGNIVMNVQSTSLSEAGSSVDILKKTPGIMIDNSDNIIVWGKGTPQIYIDGKLVRSNAELQLLPSSDIKSIEVDKTPSSEYGASASSVIRIKTRTIKNDMLNAQIYNSSYVARKYGNDVGIKLNNQTGKLNLFVSYLFEKEDAYDFFEEFDNNYFENYAIKKKSEKEREIKSNKHHIITGAKFQIDSSKSLSLQYGYSNKTRIWDAEINTKISNLSGDNHISRQINNFENDTSNNHNLTLFYKQDLKKSNQFSTTFDFVNLSYNEITNINEIGKTSNITTQLFNKSNNRILSFKTDFKIGLFKNINSKFGVKVSDIKSDGESIIRNKSVIKIDDEINDVIGAGYLILSKQINNIEISIGIRDEFTKNMVVQDDKNVIDSTYNHLFPNFMFDYTISDNFGLTLTYNKSINRPMFKEINPRYVYVDSLAYAVGNPLLLPTITHSSILSFVFFNSLTFSSEFSLIKNEKVLAILKDENNPKILKSTYINIPESKHLIFDASYYHSWDKSSLYFGVGVDFPFLEIPYLGTMREIRKPQIYSNLSYDYSIFKNINLFTNMIYQSGFEYYTTIFEDYYNMIIGMQIKLLNKKLILTLGVVDIFNTSDMIWVDKYGTVETGQIPDYDTRYLKISIKYYFNKYNKKIEDRSSIEEEKNRLKN